MKIGKRPGCEGAGGRGVVLPAFPSSSYKTGRYGDEDQNCAVPDRIEVLLESEHNEVTSMEEEVVEAARDRSQNRASGVEVVAMSVAPMLSTDTSFSVAFCEDSAMSTALLKMRSKAYESQSTEGIEANELERLGSDVGGLDQVAPRPCTTRTKSIEVALDSEPTSLLKRLLSYVPITPHGLRQHELKVFVEDTSSSEDPDAEEVLPHVNEESRESNDAYTSSKCAPNSGSQESEVPVLAKQNDCTPLKSCSNNASTLAPTRATHGLIRRSYSMPLASTKRSMPSSILAEVEMTPTYDTGAETLKEQFEATAIRDRSPAKSKTSWKTVSFGIGRSNPRSADLQGNLTSILKSANSRGLLGTSPLTEHSSVSAIQRSIEKFGPVVPLEDRKAPKAQNQPSGRQKPSIVRPYSDRGGDPEGVELVREAFGTRQHSFLRSITFDDFPVDGGQQIARRNLWMNLRKCRSEVLHREERDENEKEDEEAEPNENLPTPELLYQEEGALRRDLLEKRSRSTRKPVGVHRKSQGDTNSKGTGVAQNGGAKAESKILGELIIPSGSKNPEENLNVKLSRTESILGESNIPNVGKMIGLPCAVTQSSSESSKILVRRKSSLSHRIRRSNHHYYRHQPSLGKGTVLGRLVRSRGRPSALLTLQQPPESSSSLVGELLTDREIREVAEVWGRPDQSLRDAVDELEVELLEEKEGGKDQQVARALLFQDIRERTKRMIAEGRRAVPSPPVNG
jgi:hypothetical protein